jgi:lipoate-protein ligase A
VLHDREATYAVISPERSDLFPGGILENYRRIADVLQQALASLGIEASMSPGRRRGAGAGEASGVCFTAPSAYELVFRGCKVTGSAQKRQGNAFLQHGSIPVDLNVERLYRALNPGISAPDAAIRRLLASVGWLNRWLKHPVGIGNVEDRLIESFCSSWDIILEDDCPTPEERARAVALCRGKYANSRWNLQGIA